MVSVPFEAMVWEDLPGHFLLGLAWGVCAETLWEVIKLTTGRDGRNTIRASAFPGTTILFSHPTKRVVVIGIYLEKAIENSCAAASLWRGCGGEKP